MGDKAFSLLVVLSAIALALGAPTNETNSTTSRRSGRKYGDQPQVISIPIGYYKAPVPPPTSDESESDNDSAPPKYNVPTSFDDFVPSDKKPYYPSRGETYKNPPQLPPRTYWKGDSPSDDNAPTWTVPSPADMMMIMDAMKNANADSQDQGILSKLTSDPMTALVAVAIPLGILLTAVVPALTAYFSNGSNQNVPTVSTTATGNSARKLADNPSFVKPILEAIEGFTARSASQSTCLQRSFCEATKGSNGTDFRSIRTGIYKAFTFVDDYWLDTLGVKELMEAMGTGNCDKIQCEASPKKKKRHGDSKKEH